MTTAIKNPADLKHFIDAGLRLRNEIEDREKQLKEIEKRLKAYAEAHPDEHVPLKDEDREGTRLLITGSREIVPVIFTSDLIKQSIDSLSDDLPKIRELAGDHFASFYTRTVTYDAVHSKSGKFDGKSFRTAARELLTDAEEFISACVRRNKDGIPISQTKVSWDEAEPAA